MVASRSGAPFLTEDEVRASAALYTAAAMADDEVNGPDYFAMVAAARRLGMVGDPVVVTAAMWRAWLHPRGKDGRFIEKFSVVDIFSNPKARVGDRDAVRLRATIKAVKPDYVQVTYRDKNGKEIPARPDEGFPERIPRDEISKKIARAPRPVARLWPVGKSGNQDLLSDNDKEYFAALQGEVVDQYKEMNLGTTTEDRIDQLRLKVRRDRILDRFIRDSNAREVDGPYVPRDPRVEAVAEELMQEATKAEPQYTDMMVNAAQENGFELVGLANAVKSKNSLMRKLDDMLIWPDQPVDIEMARMGINDALRYTMVGDPKTFRKNYKKVLRDVFGTKNKWANVSIDFFDRPGGFEDSGLRQTPYRGVNARLTSPDGQKIELQFHTPQSFRVKEELNHSDYEVERKVGVPESIQKMAMERMAERAAEIVIPDGYNTT